MMTWGEFKKTVEAQGVKDEMVITWIDVTHPDKIDNFPRVSLPDGAGDEDQLLIGDAI